MSDFDPMTQARFRGKAPADLTPDEMRAALVQALKQVHYLEATRPPGALRWDQYDPTKPNPFPPRNKFS